MRLKNSQIIAFLSMALAFFDTRIFASDSTTPDPPTDTAIPKSQMTLCSDMVVNNNLKLTPNPIDQPLSSSPTCITQSGGGGGWAGGPILGILAANLSASCPANRPYLGSVTEAWGGTFWVAGGMGLTVTCCTAPLTTEMSIQTGYQTTGGTPFDTWQIGPDCQ